MAAVPDANRNLKWQFISVELRECRERKYINSIDWLSFLSKQVKVHRKNLSAVYNCSPKIQGM